MLPISHRLRGVEGVQLSVRALSSLELGVLTDEAQDVNDSERTSAVSCGVIAHAIMANGQKVFADGSEVASVLSEPECDELAAHVFKALEVISPTYARSDSDAWHEVLKKGARANFSTAIALGGSVDFAIGAATGRVVDRPDRYFGLPLAELVDAHWMVYRAARDFVNDLRGKS